MAKSLQVVPTTYVNVKKRAQQFMTAKEAQILHETYARKLHPLEFKVFLLACKRTRLDPFQRQIYAVKRFDKALQKEVMTIQTGIDGFRALAMRTGRYAGQDDAIFDQEAMPNKATVTVYGITQGIRCPYTATARFDEYYPGDKLGFMWRKMRNTMLAKCAEALALRKMAPEDTAGLYLDEELQQMGPVIDAPKKEIQAAEPEGAFEQEIEEQDEHIAAIAHEEPEEKKDDLETIRVEAFNRLIGKNKIFGSRVKDAKSWIFQKIGVDINQASVTQLHELHSAIENYQPVELPPPSDKPIENKF